MAVKAPPDAMPEVQVPPATPPMGADSPFVTLGELDVLKRAPAVNPLKALLGSKLVILAVRSADGKTGDADVVKMEDVTVEHGEITYDADKRLTIPLPRGSIRTFAAAAEKANGKTIVATPFQKKKGIGFE